MAHRTQWTNSPNTPAFDLVESPAFDAPSQLRNFIVRRLNGPSAMREPVWQHGQIIGFGVVLTDAMINGQKVERLVLDFVPNLIGALWVGQTFFEIARRAPNMAHLALALPHWKRNKIHALYRTESNSVQLWKLVKTWTVNWNWLLHVTDIVNSVHQEVNANDQSTPTNRKTAPAATATGATRGSRAAERSGGAPAKQGGAAADLRRSTVAGNQPRNSGLRPERPPVPQGRTVQQSANFGKRQS